jgi:hypothetical protein
MRETELSHTYEPFYFSISAEQYANQIGNGCLIVSSVFIISHKTVHQFGSRSSLAATRSFIAFSFAVFL